MKKQKKVITLTTEALHAIRCKGPTSKQLEKALNGNDEKDIPSSRHIRWMAAFILKSQGWLD